MYSPRVGAEAVDGAYSFWDSIPGIAMHRLLPALLFLAGAVAVGCHRPTPPPDDGGPPDVTVALPVVKTITQFTEMTGTLQNVLTADIRPQVSGPIVKVDFVDGSMVKKGQRLVQIDPRPFAADLQKAKGQQLEAEAKLKLDTANEARLKKLIGTGAITQEEYDQAVAQKDVSAASVVVAKAQVEIAALNLSYTDVCAPFDGRVDRIFVNLGNVVTGGTGQGTVLTTLISPDPIYAYFDVDEQTVLYYIQMIKEHKFKTVSESKIQMLVHLKGQTGWPFEGYLDFVGNKLNSSTGSLQIRGILPNPGPPFSLSAGMYVDGRIPLDTAVDAILIPDAAVVFDQDERVVYTVGPDNKVISKKVTLGAQAEGLRVVASGLLPTDRIIIRGAQRVLPGQPVTPNEGKITATPEAMPPPIPGTGPKS